MTGLWQMSRRSNSDFARRVELDLSYIAEQSFSLDVKILLKTPFNVFSGHRAS
jgi:lipopolysaccharide/colanic/teichoic acid biosynthesis glycosyltransferase